MRWQFTLQNSVNWRLTTQIRAVTYTRNNRPTIGEIMKRIIGLAAALLVCGTLSPSLAYAFGGGFGDMGNQGAPPSGNGPAPSYSGPGDVVSGAAVWYGLRAYNAAYAAATGNIGIFRRSSDSTTCTGIASATTGGLDLTTAYCGGSSLPTFCGASAGNCFATRLYDQSGAHACTGSVACDVVQATAAGQPQLVFNCHNTLPCLRFANGSFQFLLSATNIVSLAQPLTASFVSNQTGSLSNINVVGAYGTSVQWGYSSTTNDATFFAGSVAVATGAPQNTLHAMQIVVSASASITYIDGTQTTGLVAGPNVGTGNAPSVGANSGDSIPFNGDFYENGGWPGAFTTPQQSSINTNQHTYWGF